MTTLEVLRAARERIAKGWTRGTAARNAAGRSVNVRDPGAVQFCAVGAIMAACDGDTDTACVIRDLFADANGLDDPVSTWNDSRRTQADVLAAFDRAIAREEARA